MSSFELIEIHESKSETKPCWVIAARVKPAFPFGIFSAPIVRTYLIDGRGTYNHLSLYEDEYIDREGRVGKWLLKQVEEKKREDSRVEDRHVFAADIKVVEDRLEMSGSTQAKIKFPKLLVFSLLLNAIPPAALLAAKFLPGLVDWIGKF